MTPAKTSVHIELDPGAPIRELSDIGVDFS